MTRITLVAAMVTGSLFAQPADNAKEPRFEDYPSPVVAGGTSAAPKLSTPGQRRFRTMIRDQAKEGPNFAGHYTIAEWGCGTGCVQSAVVDNQSGAVYEPFGRLPKASLCVGGDIDPDKSGFVYRRNSSLLVVGGCPGPTFAECGIYYYLWTGNSVKPLRRVPMKRVPGCEQ